MKNDLEEVSKKITLLLSVASDERRLGKADAAINTLDNTKSQIERLNDPDKSLLLSRYWYEYGFIQTLCGNYEAAIECHENGAVCAQQIGDELRSIIAGLHENLNKYFSMSASAAQTFKKLEGLSDRLPNVSSEEVGFQKSCFFNCHMHTAEIAFDAQSKEFPFWAEKAMRHEYFEDYLVGDDPSFDAFRFQIKSRLLMFESNYDQAASIFSKILGYNIPELDSPDISHPDFATIQAYIHNGGERPIRDYRDFARSLVHSSLISRFEIAKDVMKKGLDFGPGGGGFVYMKDIERDLAMLQ